MHDSPPPPLVERLERLGLASTGQVRAVGRRARRLAKGVPLFESVWVDALAQARVLTPFQAAELNEGRSDSLRAGPYLLCQPMPGSRVARFYRARHVETGQEVRLAVALVQSDRTEETLRDLEKYVEKAGSIEASSLALIHQFGIDGDRLWAASDPVEGQTAAAWLTRHGRFPPEVVLEIARQMLPGLMALERAGLVHGDLCVGNLILTEEGRVVFSHPGLRPALRPVEGYAQVDLPPEVFDNVAPERVRHGSPADVPSEIYACGVLWWHLLTGRSPLPAGSSLAKMRVAQSAGIPDVRRLAPQTPGTLAAAVSACVRREPSERPESFSRLASTLGSSTRNGRSELIRCLRQGKVHDMGNSAVFRWTKGDFSHSAARLTQRIPRWFRVATGCLVGLGLVGWWLAHLGPPATPTAHAPAAMSLGNQTTHQQEVKHHPEPESLPQNTNIPPESNEIVLSAEEPVDGQTLHLAPGRHVHGPEGKRPVVIVPREGFLVDVEEVRFEGIDFVWQSSETPIEKRAAVIRLQASSVSFAGCRFRAVAGLSPTPVAIRWIYPPKRSEAEWTLPNGRIRLEDCILHDVEAGVDCRTAGALALEFSNVLHLGTGPLVRLDHGPRPDEPTAIRLHRTTLRESGPLLACRLERSDGSAGSLTLETVGCALLPGADHALLLFEGPNSPEAFLQQLRWSGQGSLVGAKAPIAAWRRPEGHVEVLDDASVSIAGVVRSKVTFAAATLGAPSDSRILDWQAPLRTTDPPGINPDKLPRLLHEPF